MRERLWTLANGIMLLMFLFSAAVQFNDPDPLTWIGIYCAAATVCAYEIRRRLPVWAVARKATRFDIEPGLTPY